MKQKWWREEYAANNSWLKAEYLDSEANNFFE